MPWGKTLTLLANSFSSRVVVAEFANGLLYDHPQESVFDLDLQYLSSNGNNELLNCIVLNIKILCQKTLGSIGNIT